MDEALAQLTNRQNTLATAEDEPRPAPSTRLSRNEVIKRIEEDRERHKRLRERRWVQPVSHTPTSQLPILASFLPLHEHTSDQGSDQPDMPLDIEFENEWETTSDWNEDDDEATTQETNLCFGNRPSSLLEDALARYSSTVDGVKHTLI